jgi:hypothetical protein
LLPLFQRLVIISKNDNTWSLRMKSTTRRSPFTEEHMEPAHRFLLESSWLVTSLILTKETEFQLIAFWLKRWT